MLPIFTNVEMDKDTKSHTFWNTQPVSHSSDICNQPVEIKTVENVQQEPYPLPDGFEWFNIC